MQIYDSKLKTMRDMAEEEEYIANNMPNPEEQVDDKEILDILTGETP